MTVGKCDDFSFPREHGFTGSAGDKPVKGYMRGGHVSAPKSGGLKGGGSFGKKPSVSLPGSPGASSYGRGKPALAKLEQAAPTTAVAPIPALKRGGKVKGK